MSVLLAPKLFGLLVALFQSETRRHCGGALALIVSALLETLMSALIAPIMMLIQTGSVLQILFGRDTGWNPQRRDDGSIPLRDIVRRHRSHVALGVITLIAGLMISPSLVAWMSPTIAGLILAIVLSWTSGMLSIGLALKRARLLMTPEETHKPDIARRANELAQTLAATGEDEIDSILTMHADANFRARHTQLLPAPRAPSRGNIDPDRAVAEAKLKDAENIDELAHWLKPRERVVMLHDSSMIEAIARLPAKAAVQ